jgi:hypothetical protein
MKCKVDTGAHTSALHAFFIERVEQNDVLLVRFGIHPYQRRTDAAVMCIARVWDERIVSDSGGHRERRIVIRTPVVLGEQSWPIELTLTGRDTMQFRMLLGRSAIREHYLVDPAASYLRGKPRPLKRSP